MASSPVVTNSNGDLNALCVHNVSYVLS
jgi:hypothetical protein